MVWRIFGVWVLGVWLSPWLWVQGTYYCAVFYRLSILCSSQDALLDALGGGFWGFSALVSGVTTCTFNAPEIMVAVFLRVAVPLTPFALHYLFHYKRRFDLNYGVHQPVNVVDFFVTFFLFYIYEKYRQWILCDSMSYVADVSYLVAKLQKFELQFIQVD